MGTLACEDSPRVTLFGRAHSASSADICSARLRSLAMTGQTNQDWWAARRLPGMWFTCKWSFFANRLISGWQFLLRFGIDILIVFE